MAVSLTTVTGTLEFPSGAAPARAVIRFRLIGPDKDGQNMFLGTSEFSVASSGSFSAAVQHTDNMAEQTFYEVTASYFNTESGQQVTRPLGIIKVPLSAESVTLGSLLPVKVPSDASNVHRVKRGDTIDLGLKMLDQYGRALDLTGFSIAASMRQGGGAPRALTVTRVSNPGGRFDLTLSASLSAALPLGPHDFDIKFSSGGRVSRTMTGTIIVEAEVTP